MSLICLNLDTDHRYIHHQPHYCTTLHYVATALHFCSARLVQPRGHGVTDQQSEAEHDKNDEDDDHVVVSDVFVIDSISMADWDADDFDPDAGLAAPKASDKWEGEDEDDDIKVIVKFIYKNLKSAKVIPPTNQHMSSLSF